MFARVSAKSGENIVFDPKHDIGDGLNNLNGTVFINPKDTRTRQYAQLLTHELAHTLVNNFGGVELIKQAYKNLPLDRYEEVKNRYTEFYEGKGVKGLELDLIIIDEVNSAYAEEISTSPEVWDYILEKEPTAKEKVFSFFMGASGKYSFWEGLSAASRKYLRTYRKLFNELSTRNSTRNTLSSSQIKSTRTEDSAGATSMNNDNVLNERNIRYSFSYDNDKQIDNISAGHITDKTVITSFVKSVLSMQNKSIVSKRKLYLGRVSTSHSRIIKKETGLNVEGYTIWINGGAIQHIWEEHGENGSSDQTMKDISDITNIAWAINNAEKGNVLLDKNGEIDRSKEFRNKDGSHSIKVLFEKALSSETMLITECIPDTDEMQLHIISAYKTKKSSNGQELNMTESVPQYTSKTPVDYPATNTIIPENSEKSTETTEKSFDKERRALPSDKEYLALAKDPEANKAELQRMVDEAARKSGLTNIIPEQTLAYKTRNYAPPKKTVKVYKTFTLSKNGKPSALFVSGTDELPIGVWLDAQDTWHFQADNGNWYVPSTQNPNTAGGKTGASVLIPNNEIKSELIKRGFITEKASKVTALAYRPGWHAGDLPFFPQGGKGGNSRMTNSGNINKHFNPDEEETNYENIHRYNQVVFECEMDADTDYTEYARSQAKALSKDGKLVPRKADMQSMPLKGFYWYTTNPAISDKGNWAISGSLKIVRALTQEECDTILRENGYKPQEWEGGVLNLNTLGYAEDELDSARKTLSPVTYDDNGDVIPLSERFRTDRTEETWKNEDIRYALPYSYNELIKKPDMEVTELENSVPTFEDGRIKRAAVILSGRRNARAQNNSKNTEKETFVYVKDVKLNVRVSKDSIEHGLTRNSIDTAIVSMSIGDVLKNSISVNELNGRTTNKKSTEMSYVLLGVGKNKNSAYAVRTIIDKNTNAVAEIDAYELYAIKAKKAGALFMPEGNEGEGDNPVPYLRSTISISEMLEKVKDIPLINEVLSADVAENLKVIRTKGTLSKDLRHALPKDDKVTMSRAQKAKFEANNTKSRVYSRTDAESVINELVGKMVTKHEGTVLAGNLKGRAKKQAVNFLFEALNSRPEGERGGAALDIADYIIDAAVMEEVYGTTTDEETGRANNIISLFTVIREYLSEVCITFHIDQVEKILGYIRILIYQVGQSMRIRKRKSSREGAFPEIILFCTR